MADFSGKWKNQHGSSLNIHVEGDVVTGQFDSGVGDDGEEEVSIAGQRLGDLITFHAAYHQYRTLVAWIGQLSKEDDGREVLVTKWLHESDVKDEEEQDRLWAATRVGQDLFHRLS